MSDVDMAVVLIGYADRGEMNDDVGIEREGGRKVDERKDIIKTRFGINGGESIVMTNTFGKAGKLVFIKKIRKGVGEKCRDIFVDIELGLDVRESGCEIIRDDVYGLLTIGHELYGGFDFGADNGFLLIIIHRQRNKGGETKGSPSPNTRY